MKKSSILLLFFSIIFILSACGQEQVENSSVSAEDFAALEERVDLAESRLDEIESMLQSSPVAESEILELSTVIGHKLEDVPQLMAQDYIPAGGPSSSADGDLLYNSFSNGLQVITFYETNVIHSIRYFKANDQTMGQNDFWTVKGIAPIDTFQTVGETLGVDLNSYEDEAGSSISGFATYGVETADGYHVSVSFDENNIVNSIIMFFAY